MQLERFTAPVWTMHVACGSGYYVRSLVRDMGRALGVGATTTCITRTRQGPFGYLDALHEDHWGDVAMIREAMDRAKRRLLQYS